MKLVETLKAVSLVGLAVALEVGFLMQVAVPSAEVVRAAHGLAAETTLVEAQAPASAPQHPV
ncbi:MAG TPA: hypothetical protein VD838_20275, partial [Anaeromyxobacteraceae bacterium]|nr:hypothetical protein [Anaeromyxobacteraceae bacterium]